MAALLGANIALALGPWWVRLADSGPVSAGFWRLALPLPLFVILARANRQPLTGIPRRSLIAVILAGLFFGTDLASWHIGIGMTRLGNATLFGNSGSIIVMVWGLIALRRRPHTAEWLALLAAMTGAAILFGRSLEISTRTLAGDLFCLFAGLCYAFYIIPLQKARESLGSWALLAWSGLASAPVLLAIALMRGEPIFPHVWWPVLGLALGSQVVGQGLLVWSLKHFPPLIIGLALLCQPVIGVLAGWLAFGETLGVWDLAGMALVAGALVIARSGDSS
jgi:drug/metabolite transporter (DMT)-like permease